MRDLQYATSPAFSKLLILSDAKDLILPKLVILSEAETSRREVPAESKAPYSFTGLRKYQGVLPMRPITITGVVRGVYSGVVFR